MAPETIRTRTATTGPAEKMDRSAARRRTLASDMHSPEELDERQARVGRTRRSGGPDLAEETRRRAEAEEAVPDVPPTETREPPAEES